MSTKQKRESTEPLKPLSTQLIDNLLREINRMFEYATQSGQRLKPGLRSSLARLYSIVESCDPADLLVQKVSTGNRADVASGPGLPGTGQAESRDPLDREPDPSSVSDAEEPLSQSANSRSGPVGAPASDESKNHSGDSKTTSSPGAEGADDKVEISVDDEDEESPVELILRVHSELADLVSPATPASLEATRSLGGGFRINNPVVNGLVYLTLLSLVGFLLLSGIEGLDDQDPEGSPEVSDQAPPIGSIQNGPAAGSDTRQLKPTEDASDE